MHCVFANMPALELIPRALPDSAQIESGMDYIDMVRKTAATPRSERKRSHSDAFKEGLSSVSDSLAARVRVTTSNPS